MSNKETYILLFDGVCNLCNRLVQFIIKRDPEGKFKFAPLQSETGRALLKNLGLPSNDLDSLVLVSGNKRFRKSEAVLHILKELGGFWKLFYIFIILPTPLRDFIYNIVARTRYRIFGKRDTCVVPAPEIRQKFLN